MGAYTGSPGVIGIYTVILAKLAFYIIDQIENKFQKIKIPLELFSYLNFQVFITNSFQIKRVYILSSILNQRVKPTQSFQNCIPFS